MQFADAKDDTEKERHKGQLFTWDIISDVETQGGTLVETATVPETKFTVTQGTLTITEFGNSVPYTGKLDDLSKFPIAEIVNKALKNDAKKTFDRYAHIEFNRTQLRYVATTATDAGTLYTNGSATGTNSVALAKENVKNIIDTMKERNIPWIGGLLAA